MLKIRLSRTGKKRQPSFQVLVQEHARAVQGKFIEKVGYYRPAANPKEFSVDMDRIKYWIGQGAQPSDALAVLLKNDGVDGMEKYIAPRNKQRKKKNEEEAPAETPAPAPAPKEEAAPVEEKPAAAEAPKEEAPAEEKPAETEEKPEEEK